MLRVDLEVPFADNAEAQRRGARWDAAKRVWFVPENRDASAFARWLAPAQPPNVRGHEYLIATASLACWRCRTETSDRVAPKPSLSPSGSACQ